MSEDYNAKSLSKSLTKCKSKLKSTYTVYLCIHKISYWGNQGKTNKKMSSQVISWAAKPSPYALRLSPKYRVYVAISIYN